jgi:hypothetical protein
MRRCFRMLGLVVGCFALGACAQAFAQAPEIIAQVDEPEQQNFLMWMLECLGLFGLLAVLAAVVIFFGSWIVVFTVRRPAVIASYLVFLLFPLLLAVTGALKGLVGAFSVMAMAGVELKMSQIVGALSEVLVLPLTALMLTLPSFLVVAVGLFVRTLAEKRPASLVQNAETAP